MFYLGILKERGKRVEKENCLSYAIDRVMTNDDDKKEFVDWFYSGNWIKTEKGDEENETI